ncbi:beta strand repeat-containing protein, partial [Fusobacterium sp. PH5-44]|uniref:beta strand repeat-containing protein n=1 Tax=unclassified Fusobacterium TaxID=2648384 RepID=UPI003D22FB46
VGKIEIDEVTPPVEFEPSIAVMPEAPVAPVAPNAPTPPVILPITVNPFSISTAGSGNGDGSWYWNTSGSNGIISQVIMTSGTWNVSNFANDGITSAFDSNISSYSAYMPFMRDGITQYTGAAITNQSYSGTSIGSGKMGVYRIVGSPYSSFESGTTININATTRSGTVNTLRQFVHFDPHGEEAAIFGLINNATSDEISLASGYYDITKANKGSAGMHDRSMFLMLKGNINLEGNTVNVVGLQGHAYGAASPHGSSQAYVFNTGTIKVDGTKNAIFAYTAEGDAMVRHFFFANTTSDGQTGTMTVEGTNNAMVVFDRQNTGTNHVLNFFNEGTMNILSGSGNTGVYIGTGTNGGTIELRAPITVSGGSNNVAVYHGAQGAGPTNALASKSVINAAITGGSNNVGYYGAFAQTLSDGTVTKPNHTFVINGTAVSSAGVYSVANINIGTGSTTLSGGSGNIGLYTFSGAITSAGSILINGTAGTGNVGAYATLGNSITLGGSTEVKATSTTANGGNILLASASGTGTHAGTITAASRTVRVEGRDNVGIYVQNGSSTGASISASQVSMNGTNGNIGVFSDTAGGTVNLTNGIEINGTSDTGIFVKTGVLAGNINGVNVTGGTGNTGIFLANNGSV